jgi:signal transduction histidine kinase
MASLNLAEVIHGAVDLFTPLAEDKNIVLTCNIPDFLMVEGDRRMLQRMMANLMDNAIKYTPAPGHVDINASIHVKDIETIVVFVKDTGIGITAEDLPKIFNRFFRCDQSRTTSGAGLGLSLARTIARVHGGDISVESTPERGSTFLLNLPHCESIGNLNRVKSTP